MTYKVIRFFQNGSHRTILRGLTLEEAQNICSSEESSSRTCTSKTGKDRTRKYGNWFNGYEKE